MGGVVEEDAVNGTIPFLFTVFFGAYDFNRLLKDFAAAFARVPYKAVP